MRALNHTYKRKKKTFCKSELKQKIEMQKKQN